MGLFSSSTRKVLTAILLPLLSFFALSQNVIEGRANLLLATSTTASSDFSQATSGPALRIENLTKVPETDRGFPAENFFVFHRIYDSGPRDVHNSNTVRVHSNGTEPLVIQSVSTSDASKFIVSGVNIPIGGLSLPVGTFLDVEVTYVHEGGQDKQLHKESLIIESNAVNALEVPITLSGAYMTRVEGGNEIDAQHVFQAYGFLTEMGRDANGNIITRPSSQTPTAAAIDAHLEGDIIAPMNFVQADPNKDLKIMQLAAFHGPGSARARFMSVTRGTLKDVSFWHADSYHQTFLPRDRRIADVIAHDGTISLNEPFALDIAGYYSTGGSSNRPNDKNLLGIRTFKAINQAGEVIPNEYIILMDYVGGGCGQGSSNCDWNDNVYYLFNARPEVQPTVTAISDRTVQTLRVENYDVSGSFDKGYAGNKLTYSATLSDGSRLPYWVSLDENTGVFTFDAPANAAGQLMDIVVTTVDYNLLEVSASFKVRYLVNDESDCTVNANADGLPKFIDCASGAVVLSGQSNTGIYRWRGPGNFTSSERNPMVRRAGRYTLQAGTSNQQDSCSMLSTVTVETYADCSRPQGLTSFMLEAECAIVGADWEFLGDPSASNLTYVARLGSRALDAAPEEASGHIKFVLENVEPGEFYMYGRVRSISNKNDSYYVRVNGGQWLLWTENMNYLSGFSWNEFEHGPLSLTYGTNVIEIAYRETHTDLDKIYLSQTPGIPTGLADEGNNCSDDVTGLETFVLEAECSDMGSEWQVLPNSGASNGSFITASTYSAVGIPPLSTNSFVRFDIENAYPGSYDLYIRAKSLIPSSTGLWVRINEGTWLPWQANQSVTGQFKWLSSQLPSLLISQGNNTIDIAYRHAGLDLDKLMLSRTESLPSGLGPEANNCPVVPTGLTELSLEAECGVVGSGWEVATSALASEGTYVVRTGPRSVDQAPASAAGRLVFEINDIREGAFYLYGRVNAETSNSDSYFVRINGGEWTTWFTTQTPLGQFLWDDIYPFPVRLTQGTNTIEVAYRETGAGLDKLYISQTAGMPTGMGPFAENCGVQPPPVSDSGDIVLEAECGTVGAEWAILNDGDASNGHHVVRHGLRSVLAPPLSEEGYVTYNLENVTAGAYNLFGRVKAHNTNANSFWVRLNGGTWFYWNVEIRPDDKFFWENVYGATVNLVQGDNVLQIAYRESDAELDKLLLSRGDALPDGFGPMGEECTPVTTPPITTPPVTTPPVATPVSSFSLEAECGIVGSGWEIETDQQASNDTYVVWDGPRSITAPSPLASGRIRFEIENAEAGPYDLFARIQASDIQSNSFWFRLNDGNWVEWFRDITLGQSFNWNLAGGGPYLLNEGANTLDIAYREAGAKMDKLYLTKNGDAPGGFGIAATNCDGDVIPRPSQNDETQFTLEAECAEVGADWEFDTDTKASGGEFVVRRGPRHITAPPSQPSAHVVFRLENVEGGSYYLFGRIKSANDKSDSFWVRINGGAWILWYEGIENDNRFNWNLMPGDAFALNDGANLVEIGYRETNAQLDKIFLSQSTTLPILMGPNASNCTQDNSLASPAEPEIEDAIQSEENGIQTPLDMDTWNDRVIPREEQSLIGEPFRTASGGQQGVSDMRVFPNPANRELTVQLAGEYSGEVTLQIIDANGRTARSAHYFKAADDWSIQLQLDELKPGAYWIRLITREGFKIKPFIKVQ